MAEIEKMLTDILKLMWDMFVSIISVIPTVLKFVAWVVLAIFILPCVWVAGNIYPKWVEWGEEF